MTLEKQTFIGSRNILEDGQIQVREDMYIVDTDTGERVMGPTYHRYVVAPGDDVSFKHPLVQKMVSDEWTPEIIKAYQDKLAAILQARLDDATKGAVK